MADIVTLVNRTSKTLSGTWDGRQYELKPGKHNFSRAMADTFKRQNPIMGTGLFGDMDTLYLFGIEEDNDNCSPVEQSKEISVAPVKRNQVVVAGPGGIYASERSASLPLDASFVTP